MAKVGNNPIVEGISGSIGGWDLAGNAVMEVMTSNLQASQLYKT